MATFISVIKVDPNYTTEIYSLININGPLDIQN